MNTINEEKRRQLLKRIAELGYNIGFGAKKNFASFDMINTIPGMITLASIVIGIMSLAFDSLAAKQIAAYVTVSGVIGIYVDTFRNRAGEFCAAGVKLTDEYNKLADLYSATLSEKTEEGLSNIAGQYYSIRETYQSHSSPSQLFLSDWYAHYKFFWQGQVEWIDEQKNFRLFRDQIPLSFTVSVLAAAGLAAYWCRCSIASLLL